MHRVDDAGEVAQVLELDVRGIEHVDVAGLDAVLQHEPPARAFGVGADLDDDLLGG